MADLGFSFDATEVEPSTGFSLIPTGDYKAVIVATEVKETKSGTGKYLSLEFEIVDVVCQGRKMWANLNLWNQSAKAVEIARADLSAICLAVGVKQMRDSSQLENKPLLLGIGIKNRKDTGEPDNVIKAYSPLSGVNQETPKAAKSKADKAPWE